MKPGVEWKGLRVLCRGVLLPFGFLMVACATQDSSVPASFDQSHANRFFTEGYQDVVDSYIENVTVKQLAVAGLESLAVIEPDLVIDLEEHAVKVTLAGSETARFREPAPGDAEGWGTVTTAAIAAARARSSPLEGADSERLYEAVFDGVVGELDSFSRYHGREEARANRASRDGFGGIGIRIQTTVEGIRVLSVMEKTPAERAGLRADDVIVAIDGITAINLTQRQAVNRLRGRYHSKVKLDIRRKDASTPLDLVITRSRIVPQTVQLKRNDSIAHIVISGFNQNTTKNLRNVLRQTAAEGGVRLKGYVIDLRGNPGGLLDQAVGVADLFITEGRIVSTRGRHPDSDQFFDAEPDDVANGRPVVVLINSNSASASEIVAAALQDSGRAVVIGSNSYGKGTVQNVFRLPNQGELALTWARFHAPSGYALHRRGVLPHICTTDNVDSVSDVMDRLRRGTMPISRSIRGSMPDLNNPEALKSLRDTCPPRSSTAAIDLEVAERILTEPGLYGRALGEPLRRSVEGRPNLTPQPGPVPVVKTQKY